MASPGNGFTSGRASGDDFNSSGHISDAGRLELDDLSHRSARSFMESPLTGNGSYSRPSSRDGRISRPPSRGYSEPAQILRISHDAPREPEYNNYDGFELLSASQLREQLQREQRLRKDREDELMALRHHSAGTDRPASATGSRPQSSGKNYDYAATMMDSDSGISNGMSNRTMKFPMGMNMGLNLDDSLNSTSSRYDYQRPRTPSSSSYGNDASTWGLSSSNITSAKALKDALHESEQRRLALVDKLRDAHAILKTQTQRMCEMEARLTEREFALENYATTQEGLHRRNAELERDRDESVSEKLETIRKRERLQGRIEELDHELKTMRLSHNALQAEQRKREMIVEQTHQALSMLEAENTNAQKTRETMLKEAAALRETLQMAKAKCEKLELENQELERIREGRENLASKHAALASEVSEIKQTKEELQRQAEVLDRDHQRIKEERDQFQKKALQLEQSSTDVSSKLASCNAEKERLYQDKVELEQRLQHLTSEREHLFKAKYTSEQQYGGLQTELAQTKSQLERKTEDLERIEEELSAVKKVGEVLSSEMANAKIQMEKAQEQTRRLQSEKRLAAQQQTFQEDEIKRINSEKDILTQAIETLKDEHHKDKQEVNAQNAKLKEMMRELRGEKNRLQTRTQELETKLQRANEEIKQNVLHQQDEVGEWKNTSERLTDTINRKESEIIALSNKLQEANDKNAQLRTETQSLQTKLEQLMEAREDVELLQVENKRLTQEHAEDQQVIHLLEMQKNILSKNNPAVSPRFTQEQLQAQVDHLKAELELAQDKARDLTDQLTRMKRSSMTELDSIYSTSDTPRRRSVGLDPYEKLSQLEEEISRLREMNKLLSERLSKADTELRAKAQQEPIRLNVSSITPESGPCEKCHDLEDQNTKLRNINKLLNSKVEKLENENDELRYAAPLGEVVPQVEYDRLEKEIERWRADYDSLKSDYDELEARHRRYLTEHITRALDSPRTPPVPKVTVTESNNSELSRKADALRKENEEIARKADLLQSQVNIAETTKKKTEEKIRKLEVEVHELKVALAAKKQVSVVSDAKTHANLTSEIEQKNLLIEKLQREMTNKLEDKNKIIQTLQNQMDNRITEKDAEIDGLRKERDMIQHEKKRLEKLKRELAMKIDDQNVRIHELLEESPEVGSQNKKLNNRVDQLEAELMTALQSSQTAQEMADNKIQHVQQQLKEKQQEIEEIEEQLKQKEAELENIQKKKIFDAEGMEQEVSKKLDYLKKLKERQDTQINDLKDEICRKNDQMKWWKEKQDHEFQKLRQEMSGKEKDIVKQKEEEMISLKHDLEEAKKETEKKEGVITVLREELEDEKNSKLTPRSNELSYKSMVAEKGQIQRKLEQEIELKENRITELEKKLDIQQDETIILQEMTSAMEDKSFFNYLRKKADATIQCKDCQERDETIRILTEQKKRLQDEISSHTEEIDALNDVIGDLERNKLKLKGEKKQLEQDLKQYKADAERCENLEIENEQLVIEKEELQQVKEDLQKDKERLQNVMENKRKRNLTDTELISKSNSMMAPSEEKVKSPREQANKEIEPSRRNSTSSLKAIPYPRPSLSSPRQPPSSYSSPRSLSSSLPLTQKQNSPLSSPRQSLPPSSSSSSNNKKFTLPSSTKFKAAIPCLSRAVSPPVTMTTRDEEPSPTQPGDNVSIADSTRSSSPQRQPSPSQTTSTASIDKIKSSTSQSDQTPHHRHQSLRPLTQEASSGKTQTKTGTPSTPGTKEKKSWKI
ncbi:uncharacterized protein LOC144443840 isoform X2 [Glandiceps talaboti]